MKRLVFLDRAVEDLQSGRRFYDWQAPGLGSYFLQAVLSDIERLQTIHGVHRMAFGLHRMLAARFPYAIYYRVTESEVQVVAILDLRRSPAWISSQISNRR